MFISDGKLKCAGSSLFLKNKWGIGYHLRYKGLVGDILEHVGNVEDR